MGLVFLSHFYSINIEDQYPTFKELDIAYYNKQIIQNENSSLLRTSLYCEIKDNTLNPTSIPQ